MNKPSHTDLKTLEYLYGKAGKFLFIWCVIGIAISTALEGLTLPGLGAVPDQGVGLLAFPVAVAVYVYVLHLVAAYSRATLTGPAAIRHRLPGLHELDLSGPQGDLTRRLLFFGYVLFPTVALGHFWYQAFQNGYWYQGTHYPGGILKLLCSTEGMWNFGVNGARHAVDRQVTFFPIWQPWIYSLALIYAYTCLIQLHRSWRRPPTAKPARAPETPSTPANDPHGTA